MYQSNYSLLPGSPNAPYQLFPKEIMAQIKEQLRDLKRILKMSPNNQVIKVKNGEFYRLAGGCNLDESHVD